MRPGPFSTAVAEAGVGAGLSGQLGNTEGLGQMGSGRERGPCKAAGEGARKGEQGCGELLVVSEAGG